MLTLSEPDGTITVPAATLSRLVARASERAAGALVRRPRRGVEVDVAGGSVAVTLQLAARYGAVLPEVAAAVQAEVATALERMCGLEVRRVDVSIEELV